MIIKKPTAPTLIEFEDETDRVHKVDAITLEHLYGEAIETAKKLSDGQEPRTILIYDQFRTKIVEHLGIPVNELSPASVHLIASTMTETIAALKKTFITTAS